MSYTWIIDLWVALGSTTLSGFLIIGLMLFSRRKPAIRKEAEDNPVLTAIKQAEDNPVLIAISQGKCPDCGYGEPDAFYAGPSGGAAQNIQCSNCHAKFNVGSFNGHLFYAERI